MDRRLLSALVVCGVAGCGGQNTGGPGPGQDSSGGGDVNGLNDGHGGGGDGAAIDGSAIDGLANGVEAGSIADATFSQHVITTTCPGCPPFPGTATDGGTLGFGQFTTTTTCSGTGVNPTLVYPNDGALFPPNTNVIEVQFLPGTGNQYFEIDFENAITDVRIETPCVPITNSAGVKNVGCGFSLDDTTWSYIASNNAGGDPLTVTVRGTPDGTCVAGSNSRQMLFAAQPLQGVVYYWQSAVLGTNAGTAGGVYRYDFGTMSTTPSKFATPDQTSSVTNGRCIGCHFISRDGQKMTFGNDDHDGDDEYSDLSTDLIDVSTWISSSYATVTANNLSPGFQTFSPDHTTFLASDGKNANQTTASFFLDDSANGKGATTSGLVSSGMRGTQPDWSANGSKVVYVEPGTLLPSGMGNCMCKMGGAPAGTCPATAPYDCTCTAPTVMVGKNDYDNHFTGGSLVTLDSTSDTAFASPPPNSLLASTGENNYYPAWAPDEGTIVFNRVMGVSGVSQDAFSNPLATIWAIPPSGGAPVELTKLEYGGVTNDTAHPYPSGGLTNSWPRFSPFVQPYKGKRIYWVTFSSTRDYGLRVQNQVTGQVNCYPPESIENPCQGKQELVQTNCAQPQIWMAAVTEDGLAAGDTSFPAFWLPFQSLAAHNHIAQWATTLVGGPPPADAGVPIDAGPRDAGIGDAKAPCPSYNQTCTASGTCCAGLSCAQPSNTCQLQ
jgi:hypothetical protein